MTGSPSPTPADERPPGALPEELEERAYDLLLAAATAERDAALAALIAEHPRHAEDLGRLTARLRSAERALSDTGLSEPPTPRELGPYHLQRKLGEGGFGIVWLAEQQRPLHRQVAVKLIRPGMDTANVLRRFESEREALTRFDHPCIAKVLDAGRTHDGQPFLVTEFIDGLPLFDYARRRQLSMRDRVALLAKVVEGVQHAHLRGVIHRDLKPSNVLVVEIDGVAWPKIIDFGIARAVADPTERDERTRAGLLLGTPEYMSPEQALGSDDIDVRTDVHALGVMLFELLTGDLPFGRERWRRARLDEIVSWLRSAEVPRPSTTAASPTVARALRGDLDWIVATACARERERRYGSARELAADLAAFLEHRPITASPPGLGYRLRKFVRRNRAALAAGTLIFASLATGLLVSLRALQRARDAESAADLRATELREALSQYEGLADVVRCRELRAREATLWPARPDRAAVFRAWLDDADALLVGDAARAELLAEVRRRATRDHDIAAAFLAEALAGLDQELATLRGDNGMRAWTQAGLDWSLRVEQTTLHDHAAAWRDAIAAIAASDRYGGLHLTPQLGLVPLGFDPVSELFEFWHAQSGARPQRDEHGNLHPDPADGIVLVLLPGGATRVGAIAGDAGQPFHDSQLAPGLAALHKVTLQPFLIGKYEVTRAQWQRAGLPGGTFFDLGTETGQGPLTDLHPAENLTMDEALALAKRFDLTLPTDAQWEYAYRAGTTTMWPTGDDVTSLDGFANIAGREIQELGAGRAASPELRDGFALSAPVGTFRANRFGLHDMAGNLAEMCADSVPEAQEPPIDGDGRRAATESRAQVVRGGSFADPASRARSAARQSLAHGSRAAQAGLRLARPLRD